MKTYTFLTEKSDGLFEGGVKEAISVKKERPVLSWGDGLRQWLLSTYIAVLTFS